VLPAQRVDEVDVVRRLAEAVACGVVALLLLAGVGSGATQLVTLTFARFYSNVCNCWSAKASGQVSSGAADQEIVILKQNCGRSFGTAAASARTRAGGFYETEITLIPFPGSNYSVIYRARWNGELSAPVLIRGKLEVSSRRLRDGGRPVVVATSNLNPVNLRGKQVLLQRQVGNDWTRVASARLAPHPVTYYTFVATFPQQRRGWKLRALVPAKSALPCFVASTSKPWTS
jgi:hypothetical protein